MKRILTIAVIGFAALAMGCKNEQLTPIRTLLDDPTRFDHQVVRIAGKVTRSAGVLGYGGYQVNDGTGTLTVVTDTGGAPRTDAEVGVEGEFRSAFTLGTESVAVLLEHRRFTP
jgi:hypothetical protein